MHFEYNEMAEMFLKLFLFRLREWII